MTEAKVHSSLLVLGAIILPILVITVIALLVRDTNGVGLVALLVSLGFGAAMMSEAIDGIWMRVGGGLVYLLMMAPICFTIWLGIGCGLYGECL